MHPRGYLLGLFEWPSRCAWRCVRPPRATLTHPDRACPAAQPHCRSPQPAALQRLREARPGSEDLSLLQISDGPASWGALLTSKEVTQSALKEAAAKLHDALAAESHRAEEAARDMDSELEVVERERVEAEARASRARNATAEMQREMKWLHERITMAERGVERLRDPAPAVPHVGGFRLYFQGGERVRRCALPHTLPLLTALTRPRAACSWATMTARSWRPR